MLTRTRIIVLAVLFLAPVLFLMGVGSYHLWATGWAFWAWVPAALFLLAGYLLGRHWTRRPTITLPSDGGVGPLPNYWTPLDREAWAIVRKRSEAVEMVPPDRATDPQRYADEAITLALDVARVYRPGAADPFGHLTLPEILACAELVARDLTEKVDKFVPGSHLLKVNDFRRLRQVSDWYSMGMNAYWLASAVFNPVRTGLQFAATKFGLGPQLQRLQHNVLIWFHSAYLLELGRHLIELNSGRLKVGADKYRELVATNQTPRDVPVEQPEGERGREREGEQAEAEPMTEALVPVQPPEDPFQAAQRGRYKKVANQVYNAGRGAVRFLWQKARRSPGT